MKMGKRSVIYAVYIVVGIVLLVLGGAEVVDDFWSGMGSALICVGILQLIRLLRLHKDAEYRKKMEVEISDERNRFIQGKAWAWAGYLFVLIAAVSAIVLRIAGQELLSMVAGYAVCLLMVLYWICYLILQKKY